MNKTIFTCNVTEPIAQPPYDWLNSAVAFPRLIANDSALCQLIEQTKISNPIALSQMILNEHHLTHVSPRLFYKNILRNQHIDNSKHFYDCLLILRASKQPEQALFYIDTLIDRYDKNSVYRSFILRCLKRKERQNTLWSDKRIIEEERKRAYSRKVDYVGTMALPDYARLIDQQKDLDQESRKLHHCIADYWQEVEDRTCFVITIRAQEAATCLIRRHRYMAWFEIAEIRGVNNREVSAVLITELALCIAQAENQLFFHNNSSYLSDAESSLERYSDALFLKIQNHACTYQHLIETNKEANTLRLQLVCESDYNLAESNDLDKIPAEKVKLSSRRNDLLIQISSDDFLSQVNLTGLLQGAENKQREQLLQEHKRKMGDIASFYHNIRAQKIKRYMHQLYDACNDPTINFEMDDLEECYAFSLDYLEQQSEMDFKDYLASLKNDAVIVGYLESKGYFVQKKNNSSRASYRLFLCQQLGIGEMASDQALFKALRQNINEAVFPKY